MSWPLRDFARDRLVGRPRPASSVPSPSLARMLFCVDRSRNSVENAVSQTCPQ